MYVFVPQQRIKLRPVFFLALRGLALEEAMPRVHFQMQNWRHKRAVGRGGDLEPDIWVPATILG